MYVCSYLCIYIRTYVHMYMYVKYDFLHILASCGDGVQLLCYNMFVFYGDAYTHPCEPLPFFILYLNKLCKIKSWNLVCVHLCTYA